MSYPFIFKIAAIVSVSIGIIFFHIFAGININNLSDVDKIVLFDLRLPRMILGLAVGGGLGVSGLFLQGLFRNLLVEPYTLGISGGAAVGAALSISLSLSKIVGFVSVPVFALMGGVVVIVVLLMSFDRLNLNKILLTGVIISFVSSSLLMIIFSVSKSETLHGIIYWMLGSLDESNNFLIYATLFISLFGCGVFFLISRQVNVLQMGNDKSVSLGINVGGITKLIIFVSCAITALSVTSAGMIGFIGLIIPNFMRKLFGNDYRVLTLLTFFASSSFLLICDIIARKIIAPNELPIGVITGILGGIMFLFIFKNQKGVR